MPEEGQVALSWSPPVSDGGSHVLTYNLYRGSGLTSSPLVTVNAFEVRFNDSEVSGGISYRYYVTAVNGAGEGPPSETVSVIVPRSASGQAGAGMILIGILVLMVIGIITRIALVLIASKELKK
jgi:levanase